jgi:superfamily I DNA/RNA helicase
MVEEFDPKTSRSIFVVGDDAQSIYGFRGSKIDIILNFGDFYPKFQEIILNQNYRSTQPILDLAEKILTHNPSQKKKDLFTQNEHKTQVHYYLARNDYDEAEFIVRKIKELYLNDDEINRIENDDSTQTKVDDDEIKVVLDDEVSEMFDSYDINMAAKSEVIKSSDDISSMFDLYLEKDDVAPKTFTSFYDPRSFDIPKVDWSSIKKLNEICVLYRTHSQSRSIEETLLKHRIPYRLVSGTKFLDRKEIKDVLAILRYLSNGADRISLGRFLPLVMDGVGPKTLDKINQYLEDYQYPLAPKYQELILDLIKRMKDAWKNANDLISLTKFLITTIGYTTYLKKEYPIKEEYEQRMENIGELYSLMLQFDQKNDLSLQERLTQFLIHVSLMSSLDNSDNEDTPKVNLMSLHQSKGLEFETVFLIGCEDGLLPHQNSFLEDKGMEEEVRLAYVGVTRAKKNLFLTSADSRVQFGQIKSNPPSRIFRPFMDTNIKRSR